MIIFNLLNFNAWGFLKFDLQILGKKSQVKINKLHFGYIYNCCHVNCSRAHLDFSYESNIIKTNIQLISPYETTLMAGTGAICW